MATDLPHGYRPSDEEPFMNERQREYFRRKLVTWKEEILRESRETIQNLQSEPTPNADLADRATTEAERQLELRTRDRQRKLMPRSGAWKTAPMASARKPASRFRSNGWMRVLSRPCRSRRRSAMSAASGFIATTDFYPPQNGQMISKNC